MTAENLKKDLPKSILFIDDEEDLGNLMKIWFTEIGNMKVDCFQDTEEAWKSSQSFHYDFILLDWKIDGKTDGLALLNRFRQHRHYCDIPIVVISGFLSKKEFSIVEEIPFTGRLEKPLQKQHLLKTISNLNKDCLWYKKQQASISKNIEKLIDNEKALSQLIVKMLQNTNNPVSMLNSIGKALLNLGADDKAELVFLKALEKKPNSVYLNNQLGKIYLKKERLDEATRHLEKALMYSPDNVERLCNLGNIEMQKMHLDKAEKYFDKASSIDKDDKSAKSGKVLSENISRWLKEQDSIPENFASMLNSIGISMARNGNFNKCIEHYQSALKHVYTPDLKAKVSFNLGLAYLRWKKVEKANAWFKESLSHDPTLEKASDWIDKLSKRKSGEKINVTKEHYETDLSIQDQIEENLFYSEDENLAAPTSSKDYVRQEGDNLLHYGNHNDLETISEPIDSDGVNLANCISDKLFTFIDRKPIPCTCLAVTQNKLEIQTFSEVKVDSKLVLIVDDRGYELDIMANEPAEIDQMYGFRMVLHAADKTIDLTKILKLEIL